MAQLTVSLPNVQVHLLSSPAQGSAEGVTGIRAEGLGPRIHSGCELLDVDVVSSGSG